jgi:uncharacterized protein YjbJ (UPF0337 family)
MNFDFIKNMENMVGQNFVNDHWDEIKGTLQTKFGLTDDDIQRIQGSWQELNAVLQEHGYSTDQIKQEIEQFVKDRL